MKNKEEGIQKMFGGKHFQHSSKLINELNSVNNTKKTLFRNFDEVWVIGKYKGMKLKDTPISYLKWAIKTIPMTDNSLSTLKKYIY